ncbi:Solute carrier family 40 member 1 [Strongyloides ratti]|uniref:Solute carrier family 40 member n=1 Tax=Strongyloides ratti TaxID=34506 RepID=A0A090KQI8_STRRB|nr:Solute carrier family 40 member 1 [Strongyloides ratti]CEF59788.1 Solute carrier family 40 member 1 [Strongyloides ratti]
MKKINFCRYNFYFIYTLSCLSDRLWSFAIIFILEKIGGLKLIAISQLINGLATIFLSGILGKWLDNQNRMKSISVVLFLNNIFVSLCAITYMFILRIKNESYDNTFDMLIYIGLILNSISEVASQAERMLLSKDWILVIIDNDKNKLSKKNATMTILDQIMCVIAPILIGILLKTINYDIICIIFMVWNLISWIIEYFLIRNLYMENVKLQQNKEKNKIKNDEKISLINVIQIYFSQSTFYQSLALSLLYMTVLAFDGLSLAYAKSQNITEDILGVFRGISSLTGIVGAFIYMKLERKIEASASSLCGLLIQQFFNYCCLISLVLPGTPFDPIKYFDEWNFSNWSSKIFSTNSQVINSPNTVESNLSTTNPSVWVYLITITFSRIGLWLTDLAITHQMQQSVKENNRGSVFGFQNSLCNFFSTIKDIFVILFPDIRTFGILMIISVAVGTISLIITFYSFIRKKH